MQVVAISIQDSAGGSAGGYSCLRKQVKTQPWIHQRPKHLRWPKSPKHLDKNKTITDTRCWDITGWPGKGGNLGWIPTSQQNRWATEKELSPITDTVTVTHRGRGDGSKVLSLSHPTDQMQTPRNLLTLRLLQQAGFWTPSSTEGILMVTAIV